MVSRRFTWQCAAVLLTAGLFGLSAVSAQAAIIAVSNHSFELPVAPSSPGYLDTNAIPGWTVSGPQPINSGVWQAPGSSFSSIPDGIQVAYAYRDGLLEQVVGTAANTEYVLSAEFGRGFSNSFGNRIQYTLQLLAGTNVFASFTGLVDSLPAGQFTTVTVSGTPNAAFLGQPLTIRLGSVGGAGGPPPSGDYSTFDNVQLITTPEPTSIVMFGVFGALAAGVAYRRRATTRCG